MQRNSRRLLASAAGAVIALGFSSCAYDPYYTSVGGSYSSGYGQGYGYGASNFSTSLFVSTGDPRWGYDPYCYSYYDYRRRCYYDPYLNGYYPVGYRPPVVIGVPHPYGWSPGRRYCPPPRSVRDVTVVNYRDRQSAYRNSDYSWAKQVRTQPISNAYKPRQAPIGSSFPSPSGYKGSPPQNRTPMFGPTSPSGGVPPTTRSSFGSPQPSRSYSPSSRSLQPQLGARPDFRQQNGSRQLPAPSRASGFSSRPANPGQKTFAAPSRVAPTSPPSFQGRPGGGSPPALPSPPQGGGRPNPKSDNKSRGIRSLGQG